MNNTDLEKEIEKLINQQKEYDKSLSTDDFNQLLAALNCKTEEDLMGRITELCSKNVKDSVCIKAINSNDNTVTYKRGSDNSLYGFMPRLHSLNSELTFNVPSFVLEGYIGIQIPFVLNTSKGAFYKEATNVLTFADTFWAKVDNKQLCHEDTGILK